MLPISAKMASKYPTKTTYKFHVGHFVLNDSPIQSDQLTGKIEPTFLAFTFLL